jgi:ribosomal-protein-alanine N-acetyltransferase
VDNAAFDQHDRATAREAVVVSTPRLRVRRFRETDVSDFLAYQADPVVRRYARGEPMTPDAAAAYVASQAALAQQQRDAWHAFAVEELVTDAVIGDVGFFLPGSSTAPVDLGYQLHPAWHGRGYAYEAVLPFLDFVFGTYECPSVTAGCDVGNEPSQRLMQRLGMRLVSGPSDHADDGEVRYVLDRPI